MFELIASVVGWIWNGIQALTTAIVTGLVAAFHFLAAFAGDMWSAAKWTYQNILKPVGLFLDKIYKRAVDLYDHYVQPVLDWLKRATALLRKVYFTVLSPLLAVIDGTQKLLKLLELLHIEWAKQLDDALAALERKLSLPLQTAIQFLNGIINRVESYVLTAENLFQKVTHLNTLRRDLGAVQNIQWNSLLRNVKDATKWPQFGDADKATPKNVLAAMDGMFALNANATNPVLLQMDDYFSPDAAA